MADKNITGDKLLDITGDKLLDFIKMFWDGEVKTDVSTTDDGIIMKDLNYDEEEGKFIFDEDQYTFPGKNEPEEVKIPFIPKEFKYNEETIQAGSKITKIFQEESIDKTFPTDEPLSTSFWSEIASLDWTDTLQVTFGGLNEQMQNQNKEKMNNIKKKIEDTDKQIQEQEKKKEEERKQKEKKRKQEAKAKKKKLDEAIAEKKKQEEAAQVKRAAEKKERAERKVKRKKKKMEFLEKIKTFNKESKEKGKGKIKIPVWRDPASIWKERNGTTPWSINKKGGIFRNYFILLYENKQLKLDVNNLKLYFFGNGKEDSKIPDNGLYKEEDENYIKDNTWILEKVEAPEKFEQAMEKDPNRWGKELGEKLINLRKNSTKDKGKLAKYLKYLSWKSWEMVDTERLDQFVTFVFKTETSTSSNDINPNKDYEFKLNLKF